MRAPYLEVTYRKGKPIAAYLYLPRQPGEKSARTERASENIVVDFAADGTPIGLELLAPAHTSTDEVNRVLSDLGVEILPPRDLTPLHAA